VTFYYCALQVLLLTYLPIADRKNIFIPVTVNFNLWPWPSYVTCIGFNQSYFSFQLPNVRLSEIAKKDLTLCMPLAKISLIYWYRLIVIHGYYVHTVLCVCAFAIDSSVVAVAAVFLFFRFFIYHLLMKQGVALTGRNTTGSPCSRGAITRLKAAWRHSLACAAVAACSYAGPPWSVTDDDKRR